MSNQLMMRFTREMFAPNGKREMSSTSDVDAALANAILSVFDGIEVNDNRSSAKPFRQFLQRSARDKLKIGAFDDVETFLLAMRSANGGRRDDESTSYSQINPDALPVINLGRTPGFQMHDNTHAVEDYNAGAMLDDNDEPVALLSLMPIEISYSIMMLANEKETLSMLVGTVAGWLRQYAAYGSTHFTAKSQLAGYPLELSCMFRDPKDVLINDLTPPLANNRVYAASVPVTVIAPLYTAWLGTKSTGSMEVYSNGVSYTSVAPVVVPAPAQQLYEVV